MFNCGFIKVAEFLLQSYNFLSSVPLVLFRWAAQFVV